MGGDKESCFILLTRIHIDRHTELRGTDDHLMNEEELFFARLRVSQI